MDKIINPALIGNWENWLRVFLMVAIGATVVHFIAKSTQRKKGK
jgi:hypothetical protein